MSLPEPPHTFLAFILYGDAKFLEAVTDLVRHVPLFLLTGFLPQVKEYLHHRVQQFLISRGFFIVLEEQKTKDIC